MTTKLPTTGPISLLDVAQAFDLSTNGPITMSSLFSLNQRSPSAGNIALTNFVGETNLGTQSRPASNVQEIKDFINTQIDGEYWIDVSGTPTKVFCLMNDGYGGGAFIQAYNTVTAKRVSNAIVYNVNNASLYASIPVNRVMYYMQNNMYNHGTLYWAYASFDAWNNNVTTYRIPSVADPFVNQLNVTNLAVFSNHPNVTNGTGLSGRLEIWPYNYGPSSTLGGGSSILYDYDDSLSIDTSGNPTGTFGSFQVHNMSNLSTVIAWNGQGRTVPDIGFGTNDTNNIHYVATANNNPDWTFANTDAYNFSVGVYIQPRNLITLPRLYTVTSVYDRYELSYTSIATITKKSGVTLASSDISTNTGMAINASTGVISNKPNDVSQNTTYTFNVTATDTSGNSETKQFKISVLYAGRTVLDEVTIKNNGMVAYSMRLINQSYTGPVIRVRRESDNLEKDFYASPLGDIGDEYLARGQSLSNWLYGTTGYVRTWYDQFGSNNAANATTTTQPRVIQTSGKYVVYFNGNNNLLGFTSINPISFWMNLNIIQFTNNYATVFAQTGGDFGFRFENARFTANNGDFLGTNSDPTPYWYANNAYGKNGGGTQSVTTGAWLSIMGARATASVNPINQLGRGYTPLLRDLNGYLSDMVFFNTNTISQVHSTILNTASPSPITESQLVTNGLVVWIDPGKYNSYVGSGATMYNLVDGSSNTLGGTYTYDSVNGTIRLTNSSTNRLANVSYLQLSTIANITTVSLWYYQHSSNDTRYLLDMRTGGANGFIYSSGTGGNWSPGTLYKNGGASQSITWNNIETLNTWQNITVIANIPATDDMTIFARFSLNEGLDVTFGPILVYNREITQAENLANFNALRGRFGI